MNHSLPPTEARNPWTTDFDAVDAQERVRMVLREDAHAVEAALDAAPVIGELADLAAERLRTGGRIHYAGAGASGRLAVLDATEATPTFGVDPGLLEAHFPGGAAALVDSTIDLEDAEDQGRSDLCAVGARDAVIGITASGTTAYVRGALEAGQANGALTALITSNPESPLRELAEIVVVAETGPEALTGSTRLKAGTAAKIILNAFSTAVMAGTGRTYSNLMVGLVASNEKLHERSVGLLVEATGQEAQVCRDMLSACSGHLPLALLRLLSGAGAQEAESALAEDGSVRTALTRLAGEAR